MKELLNTIIESNDIYECNKLCNLPPKETVKLDNFSTCGIFKLRGPSNYIESIFAELDCIKIHNVTQGIKEITIRPRNKNHALEIISRYPFAKVIGLYTGYPIYSIYSESGYPYVTAVNEHGYIDKTIDIPWYWNDAPDRNYIKGYYKNHYNFPYYLEWNDDVFIFESDGNYYQITIREDSLWEDQIIYASENNENLNSYTNDWKIQKYGDQYVLKEYLGNSTNVFIPGKINKGSVIVDSYLFSKSEYEYNDIIKNVYIADGCVQIKDYAFSNCSTLEHIRIPKTVKEYGLNLFKNSNRVKNDIIVGKYLVRCATGKYNGTYIVDNNIQYIVDSAFINTTGISRIILPEKIKALEDLPLDIEEIRFPESLKSLSGINLYFLKGVKNIDLPNGIKTIPRYFIVDAPKLESIMLPQTVTKIDNGAFMHLHNLKTISALSIPNIEGPVVPKHVETIGWDSFVNRVTIFDNLKKITSEEYLSPSRSILINVCSKENETLLYRVWVPFDETNKDTLTALTKLWKKDNGWNFTKYDELYAKCKKIENKFFIAICRLRFPINLDEKKKKTYIKCYESKKDEALPLLIEKGFFEAVTICNELDTII